MAFAVYPALAVLDNSRKARVHTVTDHHQHDLSHKGDAHDREEMNDLCKHCVTNDISQSESTNSWR
jgi:hypothetical protein